MNQQRSHERRRCTAKSKQTGRQCGNAPAVGRSVCRFHGGATPAAGIGHHAVKTKETHGPDAPNGKYSKLAIPLRLSERIATHAADPSLIELREETAVAKARVQELLERLGTGESAEAWRSLRKAWLTFRRATADAGRTDGDERAKAEARAREAGDTIGRLITDGAAAERTWDAIERATNWKARLATAEWSRLVDLKLLVTLDEAKLFALSLLGAVTSEVRCKDTLARINGELKRLLAANGVPIGTPRASVGDG